MASLQLKAPECLISNSLMIGLAGRDVLNRIELLQDYHKTQKRSKLMLYSTCMGEEAEVVLVSTGILEGQRKEYSAVSGKFYEFFKVRRNVIFERARFNKRNQLCRESAEQYIMDYIHWLKIATMEI